MIAWLQQQKKNGSTSNHTAGTTAADTDKENNTNDDSLGNDNSGERVPNSDEVPHTNTLNINTDLNVTHNSTTMHDVDISNIFARQPPLENQPQDRFSQSSSQSQSGTDGEDNIYAFFYILFNEFDSFGLMKIGYITRSSAKETTVERYLHKRYRITMGAVGKGANLVYWPVRFGETKQFKNGELDKCITNTVTITITIYTDTL